MTARRMRFEVAPLLLALLGALADCEAAGAAAAAGARRANCSAETPAPPTDERWCGDKCTTAPRVVAMLAGALGVAMASVLLAAGREVLRRRTRAQLDEALVGAGEAAASPDDLRGGRKCSRRGSGFHASARAQSRQTRESSPRSPWLGSCKSSTERNPESIFRTGL